LGVPFLLLSRLNFFSNFLACQEVCVLIFPWSKKLKHFYGFVGDDGSGGGGGVIFNNFFSFFFYFVCYHLSLLREVGIADVRNFNGILVLRL
jgi:hypothetical protein